MYKINGEVIKDVECYLEFANAWLRLPNGYKIEKYSPSIWVKGINKKNEEPQIMIETFISYEELKNFKLNKEVDLCEYITDVLFFPRDKNVEYLRDYPDSNKVTVNRINENLFNFKAKIKKINLEYDVEIAIPPKEGKA